MYNSPIYITIVDINDIYAISMYYLVLNLQAVVPKFIFKYHFFFILAMLIAHGGAAQVSTQNHKLKVQQVGVNEGLSQSAVGDIIFDNDGYLWATTKDGLNRYDGKEFKTYYHDKTDTNSISQNHIRYLHIDSKGNLWIITVNGNLDMYDKKQDRFIHVDIKNTQAIHFAGEDHFGNVIITTNNGVNLISAKENNGEWEFARKKPGDVYPELKKVLNTKGSNQVMRCLLNGIVTCEYDDSLYIFIRNNNPKANQPLAYSLHNKTLFYSSGKLKYLWNEIFLYDSSTHVISRFDTEIKEFIACIKIPVEYGFGLPYIDEGRKLWLQDNGTYLTGIDLNTGSTDRIILDWSSFEMENIKIMGPVTKDNHENIWIRSYGFGLLKIQLQQLKFRHTNHHVFQIDGIEHIFTPHMRVAVAGEKALFSRGIRLLWQEMHTRNAQIRNILLSYGSPNNLAYNTKGLFVKPLRTQANTHDSIVAINPSTLEYKVIAIDPDIDYKDYFGAPLFLDCKDDVWFGDRNRDGTASLYHINSNNGITEKFPFPIKQPRYNEYRFIMDWYEEKGGKFWFATTNGVYSFESGKNEWGRFGDGEKGNMVLSHPVTMSICPDPAEPERYMWIGTDGGGLNRLDKTNGTFDYFTTDEGLPNNVIYGIQTDTFNNLWLSTNMGLCRFNTQTYATRNFTIDDGLSRNEFDRYAFGKDSAGNLYFASVTDIVYFNPADFHKDVHSSPLVINKLKLQNRNIEYKPDTDAKQAEGYVLSAPVEYCEELVFPYDQSIFTLGFTLLDLTNPGKNKYKYMLEGFHADWIDAGTINEATFTNISPGSYIFKVIGRNSNHIWNEEPATIKITILPPWWSTWWFRTLLILLVAGILYAIYRIRLHQLLAVEKIRNNIAQDLHDEIGSTLSSISLLAAVAKKNIDSSPDTTRTHLDTIIDNTSEMMESMNDIVWATKQDEYEFEDVINRMRAFAVKMTEAKGMNLDFQTNLNLDNNNLGIRQSKDIYMFFKEAINNAVKHSECDKIVVTIIQSKKTIEITITDNGVGFEHKPVQDGVYSFSGNGLNGMHYRAKQIGAQLTIDSAPGKGTTINLQLPR